MLRQGSTTIGCLMQPGQELPQAWEQACGGQRSHQGGWPRSSEAAAEAVEVASAVDDCAQSRHYHFLVNV